LKVEQTRTAGSSWKGADPAHNVACPGHLAAAILAASFENFQRFSRGGLEIGGVLLGGRTSAGLLIEQWVPIECEHVRGPAFLLSERDKEALERSLADARRCGLEAIGWFVSHSRSALALSDSDLEIFNRFFPYPWQITLVIKPALNASARARIGSRDASGIVFGPEFGFDTSETEPAESAPKFARRASSTPELKSPVRVRRTESERSSPPDPPVQSPPRTMEPPRFAVANPAAGSTRWVIVAVGACCLLVAALMFARNASVLLSRPSVNLGLRAIGTGEQLRVEWNAGSPLVLEAQHATVDVNDGGQATKLLLNKNHLRMGSFEFLRHSNDVEFVFSVHRPNQAPVQEWTRFISAAGSASIESPPSEAAPPDRISELESENKRLHAALQAETAKRIQLEQAMRILRQHLGFK
jgi:hypothetical protein